MKDLDEAKKIYEARVKEYEEVADIIVNVEDWNTKRIVDEILVEIDKN